MKMLFGKKGQMSIEMLLITSIIIMLSIGVFSYYTGMMDATTAMEIIEIETLRQIDAKPEQYFIKAISYTTGTTTDFCIEIEPKTGTLYTDPTATYYTDTIKEAIIGNTAFEEATIEITLNPPPGCQ